MYSRKEPPMTIAVDCRMIGASGIGTYIESLVPYFLEESQCLLIGDEKILAKYSGDPRAEICPCRAKPFSLAETFFFPRAVARRANARDVFYTPYCNIPSGIRVPIFSTIHDVVFLDVPGLSSKAGTFARKIMYGRAVKKSRALFTVSNFSADRIRANLKCGSLPIIVTHSALPGWLARNDGGPARKKRRILFVGNIKRHKGLSILIDAFEKALSRGLDARLVIAGSRENFRTKDDGALKKISALPEGSVEFTGRVSNEELSRLYRESALLAQPSLYEGFGLPPLEALSNGTRAVVSDIPVFREIYKDFPVTFFKAGDSADLCEKLIACMEDFSPENFAPSGKVPDVYSFKKTARVILDAMKERAPEAGARHRQAFLKARKP